MTKFAHQRHKPPSELNRQRELIIACPLLRSRVNLSRIVRVAGSLGVHRIIACRPFTIDPTVARDATEHVAIEPRRSLPPVLRKLKQEGYAIVGLEQSTHSTSLFEFQFPARSVLVLGHERTGISEEVLAVCDHVAEIPVYGRPMSYNVASAATMAVYEYCRQWSN